MREQFDLSSDPLARRVVRYADLRPCLNAFIDSRSPRSSAKENFTIIGPGVSENPNQHVHIAVPHGFNIGGARQPPGCVNSQHSHDTAEVFVVHTGRWRFDLGEHGDDARVECGPGDVIALPTGTFRGFTNIGDDTGFLWAVLGKDDPGRVLWAPRVFDLAADHGLVLLDSGRLIDTAAGEAVPADAMPMSRTTPTQVAALRRYTDAEAAALVARDHAGHGERGIIAADGPLPGEHGLTLHRLDLAAGESATLATPGSCVVFVHRGIVAAAGARDRTTLAAGDTMSLSAAAWQVTSDTGATAFVVRGTPS